MSQNNNTDEVVMTEEEVEVKENKRDKFVTKAKSFGKKYGLYIGIAAATVASVVAVAVMNRDDDGTPEPEADEDIIDVEPVVE